MVSNNLVVNLGPLVLLVIGVQVLLSTRKHIVYGLVLPALFLYLGGYNLYKSLYVYNPYPTMTEGMYMTAGCVGFVLTVFTLIICRVIIRSRAKRREQQS